ncbi:BQ5605_C044g12149 [Microbotryum silenes-dioicae]|uniref:BQ5605_C044g12149 protein n=1 Tax=Microbotryum silenes-dioicae TaxID=796604 RepID=A0A2X0PPT1_9BASI|nr:BQ5605_C044g12149 [Microbotryum silenes-dioicae]
MRRELKKLVPSLPCNLLSVRHLDHLGFSISFGSGCTKISNSCGTVVATAQAVANDLYALNVAPSPCMPNALLATPHRVSLLTLHSRLAHLPIAQLKNIVQKGLVTGVDRVYSEEEIRNFNCNACLGSKRTDLNPKAVSLIFVGLDDHTKAYCLFDPATRKILLSRNIVFRESEFPALQPVATTHTGAIPLPVAADIYPDQVDHSEPLLVAPLALWRLAPRSLDLYPLPLTKACAVPPRPVTGPMKAQPEARR